MRDTKKTRRCIATNERNAVKAPSIIERIDGAGVRFLRRPHAGLLGRVAATELCIVVDTINAPLLRERVAARKKTSRNQDTAAQNISQLVSRSATLAYLGQRRTTTSSSGEPILRHLYAV